MKSQQLIRVSIVALLLLTVDHFSIAQNSDPGAYMDFIGNEYKKMAEDMMSYTSAAAHSRSARKIDKRRTELVRQLKETERNIRAMKPYNGDHSLRDSIASYLRICSIVLNEDYSKILDMEDIAEQSYDAMEAYLLTKEKANEKLERANTVASDQYKKFAADNGINLIENESKLHQKIEEAGKVIKYHDVIYLLFFRSFKNEAYLLDALSRDDVNALQQSANTLLSSSSEDLAKIGKLAAFKGDHSLKAACQKMLVFYKQEATKTSIFIDYLLEKEKFDKIAAALEAKKEKDRTKSDIDLYNKAVNDFNAFLRNVNQANDELNKERNSLLNNWNKASNTFIDKHTPKYK